MTCKRSAADPTDVFERITIVGAGRMGHGIGLWYALNGCSVTLFDVDEDLLAESEEKARYAATQLVSAGEFSEVEVDDVLQRIHREPSLRRAVADAEFVTEAIVEDLAVKQDVFRQLDDLAPDGAVLATNTSGLSITEIASVVDDPTRVLGTHWFNPPYIVPLVEVVKGEESDGDIAEKVHEFLSAANKTPVLVEKDITGFIGNRIQMAMSYEAFSLLSKGVASPEAIDRAVKAGFGFRLPVLGIFEKVDHSGLDVQHDVDEYLMGELDRGTEPKQALKERVEEGKTGLEAGEGIYDWSDADQEEVYRRRDEALLELLSVYRSANDGDGR